jgi:hypothetical protein
VASVLAPEVAPQGRQTVTGSGFTPGEVVDGHLHSTPVDLGTATADAQGRVMFTVDLPAAVGSGEHDVVLQGASSGRTASADFLVRTVRSSSALPVALLGADGAGVLAAGVLGGMVLAVGVALAVAVRRPA